LDPDGLQRIPADDQIRLLKFLGIENFEEWRQSWIRQHANLGLDAWHPNSSADWLWSLGLPILSLACREPGRKRLIGISALPGCGKSSLGIWLETAARNLGLSLQVVSIDDFYFPADQLERSMQGNPWGVPRALPGSHDVKLLQQTLAHWRKGQDVQCPQFDKALRNGRGDRSGWRACNADLLVLEGWFVGCEGGYDPTLQERELEPPLTANELGYRKQTEQNLQSYQPIWTQLDQLWQLRATDSQSPRLWKRQQEHDMQTSRGSSLNRSELDGFIRMILSAIPSETVKNIPADIVLDVDSSRELTRIHLNQAA
jgi:D-glycerate 3-kinase